MSDLVQIFRLEDKLEIIYLNEVRSILFERSDISSYQKILDYLQLEERRQEVGEKGEQFVYEREKLRLKNAGSEYANFVSRSPAKDPRNGYDIDSFTENGEKIYVEVKSTTGNWNEPFYMTANEREKAIEIRKNGGIYQVHRVYNIEKDNGIGVIVYEDDSVFDFEEVLYCINIK